VIWSPFLDDSCREGGRTDHIGDLEDRDGKLEDARHKEHGDYMSSQIISSHPIAHIQAIKLILGHSLCIIDGGDIHNPACDCEEEKGGEEEESIESDDGEVLGEGDPQPNHRHYDDAKAIQHREIEVFYGLIMSNFHEILNSVNTIREDDKTKEEGDGVCDSQKTSQLL